MKKRRILYLVFFIIFISNIAIFSYTILQAQHLLNEHRNTLETTLRIKHKIISAHLWYEKTKNLQSNKVKYEFDCAFDCTNMLLNGGIYEGIFHLEVNDKNIREDIQALEDLIKQFKSKMSRSSNLKDIELNHDEYFLSLEEKATKIENEIKQDMLSEEDRYFLMNKIIIFLSFIILAISVYLFNILEKRIEKDKKDLQEKSKSSAEESKMASIGDLITNIAHQWRQPLALATAIADGLNLKSEYGNLSKEELNKDINRIIKTMDGLSDNITDISGYFKKDSEPRNCSAKKIFEINYGLLEIKLDANNIVINKDIDEIEMHTFKNELVQLVFNILNNSIEALIGKNEEGNRFIDVIVREKDEEVSFSIRDNAGGISLNIINKVFEPYFTTKHKAMGVGMGLYMTRELIKRTFDGKMSLENIVFEKNGQQYSGLLTTVVIPKKRA